MTTQWLSAYIFSITLFTLCLLFLLASLPTKLKTIFVLGLSLFASVYFGMSTNTNLYFFFGLFFLYGIYASATEGITKGWILNITEKRCRNSYRHTDRAAKYMHHVGKFANRHYLVSVWCSNCIYYHRNHNAICHYLLFDYCKTENYIRPYSSTKSRFL